MDRGGERGRVSQNSNTCAIWKNPETSLKVGLVRDVVDKIPQNMFKNELAAGFEQGKQCVIGSSFVDGIIRGRTTRTKKGGKTK